MIFWFGFHPRAGLAECLRRREWMMFGHVEAWSLTHDGIWCFFDPRASGTRMFLTSDDATADSMAARRYATCHTVLRYYPGPDAIAVPLHPTMTCASQCAHLVGLRAYTTQGLARILRAKGATEVRHEPARRPRNQSRP